VLAAAGVVHGIAAIWLMAAIETEMDLGLWAACYLVLDAFVLALAGIVVGLRRLHVGRIAAGLWPLRLASRG